MMMTPCPAFDSEPNTSSAFARLHPRIQRWVYDNGWTSLHDAQECAIGPILDGNRDLIISAATAAGKTEAAFLPICSVLAEARDRDNAAVSPDPWLSHDPWAEPATEQPSGVEALYVSPLKALINDQFDRLDQLCEGVGIPVCRWHGDVSGSAKQKLLRNPSGILLITPESLEALFVNRGASIPELLGGLRYVVVDELHSFLATPRGAQLQSLLNRVEVAIRRRPPRIGLSATLGDMLIAATFLRPSDPSAVLLINSDADERELQLQVRGYLASPPKLSPRQVADAERAGETVAVEDSEDGDRLAIRDHLFRVLRGRDNLVFANARRDVEDYADLLARRCERERVPNEFWAHHGSLAKDVREVVEAQLKDRTRPVTAVCTSTLEMGIDIGSVASIAQIGPPPSVASLRQRLGRSGRRDEPSVLRVYVTEDELDSRSNPVDELRCALVQTVAMVQLLLERWVESPDDPGLNYSTLVQQILSMIAQHGGATPLEIHRTLCGPGPFECVDSDRFARLLRDMAAADLIVQMSDGLLLHGQLGEKFVNHYSFYTAFQTSEEWRLVAEGRALGSLPITQPLAIGGLLVFAGRRWRIVEIDAHAHVVELTHSAGGKPPNFGGAGALVSDEVRRQMVAVYGSANVPDWLDREATALLDEGRAAWRRFNLERTVLVASGTGTVVLPWCGDRALVTLNLLLRRCGADTSAEGPSLSVSDRTPTEVMEIARAALQQGKPDSLDLARGLENTQIEKWDWVLDNELSAEAAAARLLDVERAWEALGLIAQSAET